MSIIIKRRELVAALGSAAAWSLAARAQQSWVPVVGFLNSASAEHWAPFVAAFRQGLSDAGYIEGQNVVVEYRWADDQYDRLPALAADLVRRHVNVIAANHVAAEATKSVVTTIPIVFTTGVDPVELGLVASLSRPGGNLTGITTLNEELVPKRMELLREVLPTARSIAILLNPTNPGAHTVTKHVQAAARALGLDLHLLPASDDQQLEAAFRGVAGLPSGGVVIGPDPFLASRSERLAELALAHKLPAVFAFRQFVAAGGLMSYGGSLADVYRLSGIYVGRILKGEKPADLPVQQSTKVELLINLRTAKTLGLTIPLSLTGRADEVIE
jgi:putative ABC transport system substrate-binding protein